MELHHDPFLSFALSGYNHEWYGTVHAHHVSSSFPDSTQAEYAHIRIIHDCIQALPYRISVYRKQAGNSETMTSYQRGRHGTAPIRSDTWRQSAPLFICSTAIIQRRNKTSTSRSSFVHPHMWTLQTITGKVKPNHASIPHAIIGRKLNPAGWHLPVMTGSTRPQVCDNLAIRQRGIGKYSDSRTVPVIKDSIGFPDTNICDEASSVEDSIIIASRKTQCLQTRYQHST